MNVYQIVTDRIITMLEHGTIPWRRPWRTVRDMAYSRTTGRPYSLLNQLLLDKPGEYLTFKQVQAAGGRIRKGEKAKIVVFWRLLTVNGEDADPEDDDGAERVPLLRYYNVFHIDQCEGIERKWKDEPLREYFSPVERAEEVAAGYLQRSGCKLNIDRRNESFYRPSADTIFLPLREQFESDADYYAVLFHEMGHSTGHESRLNRLAKNQGFGSEAYSKEELVAELTAACMMNHLGLETPDTVDQNAAYIQSWITRLKNDNRLIVSASSRAEKAVNLILGITDTTKQEAA